METLPLAPDRKRKQLSRQRVYERAREVPVGIATFLLLSSVAIRLSVQSERNRKVRDARKELLLQRWRQLSGDILHTPFPGARLP